VGKILLKLTNVANTIGDTTWRTKFKAATLQEIMKVAMVAEKICEVDRTDNYTIKNPYGSDPTVAITSLQGTYDVSDYTTTDDTLTVGLMFKIAEHVPDYEEVLSNYDLFANRISRQAYKVAAAIDACVVNLLCENGTGTYSTPAGGFTTASNFLKIMSNLNSKWAGFAEVYKGLFLVVENTDLTGILEATGSLGYSMADSALKNGLVTSFQGVDIYVVRTGTFADTSYSSYDIVTNSGHRVAGIKGVATYAAPRNIRFEEKSVSGKTGKEIVTWGYIGFKCWAQVAAMIIDITIS